MSPEEFKSKYSQETCMTWRMPTPSGWVVQSNDGLTYVPDAKHEWKV